MTKTQIRILLAMAAKIASVLLHVFIVQACWNFFVPAISALPQISFFQAVVLVVGVRSLKGADLVSLKKEES